MVEVFEHFYFGGLLPADVIVEVSGFGTEYKDNNDEDHDGRVGGRAIYFADDVFYEHDGECHGYSDKRHRRGFPVLMSPERTFEDKKLEYRGHKEEPELWEASLGLGGLLFSSWSGEDIKLAEGQVSDCYNQDGEGEVGYGELPHFCEPGTPEEFGHFTFGSAPFVEGINFLPVPAVSCCEDHKVYNQTCQRGED